MPFSSFDRGRLRQTPLLADLPVDSFDRLVADFAITLTEADNPLFSQGDPARALQIVLDGRVALLGRTADHRECILAIIGPGEGLIDPSALVGAPHPVSARTLDSCRIATLPAPALRRLVDAEPGLCFGATSALVRHWRLLLRRLEDQKLRSAPQRLASYLLECAQAATVAGAPNRFILAEDRRTLASHLGMTPENLSRVIGQLRQQGVAFNGRAVTIADLDRLRHFGCTTADL